MRKIGNNSEFTFGIYWWTLNSLKNQTFEKMKKIAGDIIIFHMCTKNHNHLMYSSWDTKWDRIFFVILGHFCPFNSLPPNNRENQNFEETKKAFGDVIILNLCNKKHDHMMYAYSDMECNRQFFVIFALLPQYWTWKFKFQNNVKNTRKYYPFTHVYHKSRSYDVWFLRYKVQRTEFFVILGHFLPLTLLTTQKIRILKTLKKLLKILSFYTCVTQMMIIWCMVPEIC